MKNLIQYCAGLMLLLICFSCSKKEKTNCLIAPAALILPSFNFQLVDKNTGADLFFSAQPAYSLNDIKVIFKNANNKVDSLAPPQKISDGSGEHFQYVIPGNHTSDTCFIKIKNLKTDTVISTLATKRDECSTSIAVIKVQVNNNAPFVYSYSDKGIV